MGVGARLGIRTRTSRHRGGRAAVTPAGRRPGVPEPAYATIHSGWVCGKPGASGLRHAKVVCHGVTVRRAHPADTMGTPTGPAPVIPSRMAMRRGATPSVSLRDSTE